MVLITGRRESGASIPPGEKLRFGIKKAVEDWGEHGPQVRFTLEVLDGKYRGETITDWAGLAQPRLDFVCNLRKKDYSDEKIEEILRDRDFEFDEIDEPEKALGVSDGGKLFNICMAAFDGDVDAIRSFGDIPTLLDALVGKSFVSITRARGSSGKYVGTTWDQIYTDTPAQNDADSPEPADPDTEEDFSDMPL